MCIQRILLPSTVKGVLLRWTTCGVIVVLSCGLIIFGLAVLEEINRRSYPELVSMWCPDTPQSIGSTWVTLNVHNLELLEVIWDMRLYPDSSYYGTSFTPDSNMLLVQGYPQSAYRSYTGATLWHLDTGCMTQISSAQFSVAALELSQDSKSLRIQVSDNRQSCTGGPRVPYELVYFGINLLSQEQFGPYSFAEFIQTPDGQRLSVIECHNSNSERKLVNTSTGQIDNSAPQFFANARTVSPNNQFYVTTQQDGVISLWRTDTNEHVWDFPPDEDDNVVSEFKVHDFSPDSHWLMARGGNADYDVWNVTTGQRIITSGGWQDAHFSPDSQLFAHGQTVWNLSTGDIKIELDGGTFRSFSTDGTFFAVIRNGLVEFRLSDSGEVLYTLDVGRDVRELAFSPDGRFIALKSFERPNQVSEGYLFQSSYSEIWGIPTN